MNKRKIDRDMPKGKPRKTDDFLLPPYMNKKLSNIYKAKYLDRPLSMDEYIKFVEDYSKSVDIEAMRKLKRKMFVGKPFRMH